MSDGADRAEQVAESLSAALAAGQRLFPVFVSPSDYRPDEIRASGTGRDNDGYTMLLGAFALRRHAARLREHADVLATEADRLEYWTAMEPTEDTPR